MPGAFAAVHLSNYKKVPIIGTVVEVMEDKFKIRYWVDGYSKQWKEHLIRKGRGIIPWEDTLPKTPVILCGFKLDCFSVLKKVSKEVV